MRVNGICIVTDDVARLRSFYADALRAEAADGNILNFYANVPPLTE